jgi:UDP-N-acetylmuramoylalanine--D-glutamate ligase
VITARAFAGKHYAVYGLARSGIATVQALLASGAKVTAWDAKEEARAALLSSLSRSDGEGDRSAKLSGGGVRANPSTIESSFDGPPPHAAHGEERRIADLDTADLSQFDSLVVTPGLPLNRHPIAQRARDAGIEIIGDIELFARARPGLPPHKVVGITGTNGKSTTTALVHHILETAGVPTTMGGNIGLPILAQDPLPEGGVYVLELSSYQIDLTQSLDCDVAVLLNITPDHLDRHGSFEAYAASKARLFEMQSDGVAVITDQDATTRKIMESLANRPAKPGWFPGPFGGQEQIILWSPEPGRVARPMVISGESPFGQEKWPTLAGPHNAQNAAAAISACRLIGLSPDQIAAGLRTYPGLPHRMERVRQKDGVLFVNDSKATNPTATAPALAAFERIRWICGGLAKADNLHECAPYLGHVRSAYTIGEAAGLFEGLLSPHIRVKNCGKLDIAVREAAADAEAGDTVLLSPACASFDQFRDFEDRGEQFRRLVEGL